MRNHDLDGGVLARAGHALEKTQRVADYSAATLQSRGVMDESLRTGPRPTGRVDSPWRTLGCVLQGLYTLAGLSPTTPPLRQQDFSIQGKEPAADWASAFDRLTGRDFIGSMREKGRDF